MRERRLVANALILGIVIMYAPGVASQEYPTKPVRLATGGVGGSSDNLSRIIAQGISGPLGQQVIVVNHPSGNAPGLAVAKAPPDGYTLLVSGVILWVGPLLQKDPPFDPVRDFAPVSLVTTEPTILVVHPALPVKSVKELIALAKARPGELNSASGQAGGSGHLSVELFKAMAGVNIVNIPYSSGSLRTADLLGGQTQLAIDGAATMMPYVKAGRLRGLAVASLKPSLLVPGLPTISESGVPGYEAAGRNGVLAPAKTPGAIISRLNQEIARFVSQPDVKQKFLNTGAESVGSSPEEFASIIKSDIAKLGKVIKDAGIQAP